ncbi:MAG: hypothetical protein V3U49_00480 [Nitrososphaerales archaeon]
MSKPRRRAKTGPDIIEKSLLGTNLMIAIVAGAALLVSVLTFFAANSEAIAANQIAVAALQQVEAAKEQVVAAQQQVAAAEAQLQYVQAQSEASQALAAAGQQQIEILRKEQSERFRPWIGTDSKTFILWVLTSDNQWLEIGEWCQTVDCESRDSFAGVQQFQIELFTRNYGEQPALLIMQTSIDSIETIPLQVDLPEPVGPIILMPTEVSSFLHDIDAVSFVGALFGDNPYYFMYRTEYKSLDGRDGFYQLIWRWDGEFITERESAG